MDFKPVKSSNVEAIHHDPTTSVLHIRYKGGAVYRYEGVNAEKHAALMGAKSVGGFVHANIKGQHKHSMVEPE